MNFWQWVWIVIGAISMAGALLGIYLLGRVDGLKQKSSGLADRPLLPGYRYGDGDTWQASDSINIELCEGTVVAVWFRCRQLKFTAADSVPREDGNEAMTHPDDVGQPLRAVVFRD